ncbi:glycosyltransferase family 9 protein [Sphingomonas sp. 22176]|uniref:glycosyltransferase family 9 protein n=1 Tax=Sphingomonas sp. 22176 TaxID=3453884 RepID=UPI003F84E009
MEGRLRKPRAARAAASTDVPRKSRGIAKLIRLRFGLPYVRRGDVARERAEWVEAVYQYRRALDWLPWREDLKIQIGNSLKAFGDIEGALASYLSVRDPAQRPKALAEAADAHRREGFRLHSYNVTAEPERQDAAALAPPAAITAAALPGRVRLGDAQLRAALGSLMERRKAPPRLAGGTIAAIKLDQVGSMTLSRDGLKEPFLAGVVALRGRVLSVRAANHVELWLGIGDDARLIQRVPTKPAETHAALKLRIFNLWIDSAQLPPGRHWLSIAAGPHIERAGLFVTVGSVDSDEEFASSNGYVPSPPDAMLDCDAYVEALPAVVRPAARTIFDRDIRSILVMRADQLGDLSASLPAISRLRALFPAASITALTSSAHGDIVDASNIVDEVLTVSLAYDPATEKRSLSAQEHDRLTRVLERRAFDLAIDLSPGNETRPLLLLCNAHYLVGFNPAEFEYLDFGISIRSRDKVNLLEKMPHSAAVLGLIEALGVASAPQRPPVRRNKASWARGDLSPGEYVVLHTGARHPINRWPLSKFIGLSNLLLEKTNYDVVLFFDDNVANSISDLKKESPRVHVLSKIPMSDFDEIISNAVLVVANDSGPKHLAATRGVPTVSLHVDRLNWNEWGQDGEGVILSKRVPCTGCGLNDLSFCGKAAACITSIEVAEVLEAIMHILPAA